MSLNQQQQQQQQIWHHVLCMYSDVRRLPPEMLSALVQPPFSSSATAAMLMTSSTSSTPSGHQTGPTGTGFDLATSVRVCRLILIVGHHTISRAFGRRLCLSVCCLSVTHVL